MDPKDLEVEIAEMLDDSPEEVGEESLGIFKSERESAETSDEPIEETPGEVETPEESAEDMPQEGEPAEEQTSTDSTVKEEVEEEVVEPAPEEPSEIDALKSQVQALIQLVNKTSTPKQEKVSTTAEPEPEPQTLTGLLDSIDFDEVMESKESFKNFFLNSMEVVKRETQQSMMASIPTEIDGRVQKTLAMKDTADRFYAGNPELANVKGYVSNVAAEVAGQNPEWDLSQVLEKTGEVTRTALGLSAIPKVAPTPTPKKTGPKPSFAGGTRGTKVVTRKGSSLQDEINELLD